jgi:hypothetical protein
MTWSGGCIRSAEAFLSSLLPMPLGVVLKMEVSEEVGGFRLLNQKPHQILVAVGGCRLEGIALGAPVDWDPV